MILVVFRTVLLVQTLDKPLVGALNKYQLLLLLLYTVRIDLTDLLMFSVDRHAVCRHTPICVNHRHRTTHVYIQTQSLHTTPVEIR